MTTSIDYLHQTVVLEIAWEDLKVNSLLYVHTHKLSHSFSLSLPPCVSLPSPHLSLSLSLSISISLFLSLSVSFYIFVSVHSMTTLLPLFIFCQYLWPYQFICVFVTSLIGQSLIYTCLELLCTSLTINRGLEPLSSEIKYELPLCLISHSFRNIFEGCILNHTIYYQPYALYTLIKIKEQFPPVVLFCDWFFRPH